MGRKRSVRDQVANCPIAWAFSIQETSLRPVGVCRVCEERLNGVTAPPCHEKNGYTSMHEKFKAISGGILRS